MADLQTLLDRYSDRTKVSTARRGALSAYVRGRGPDATNLCLEALDDPEPTIRKEALRLLGERRDAAAVVPLLKRLAAADGETQRQILGTLGQIGDESARPAIERLLEAEDFFVRSAARRALGEIAGQSAAPPPLDVPPVQIMQVQIETPPAPEADASLLHGGDEDQHGPAELDPTAFRKFAMSDMALRDMVQEAEAEAAAAAPAHELGGPHPAQPTLPPQQVRRKKRHQAAPAVPAVPSPRPVPPQQAPQAARIQPPPPQPPQAARIQPPPLPPPPRPPSHLRSAMEVEPVDVQLGPSRPLLGRPAPPPPVRMVKTQPARQYEPVRPPEGYQEFLSRRQASSPLSTAAQRAASRVRQQVTGAGKKTASKAVGLLAVVVFAIFLAICSGMLREIFR